MRKKARIAIVGGGVAGASSALYLSSLGLDVTLFEKEHSLVNGPPFCHLHAGGNLYPDISDAQCITLLKQSIDFLRFYPQTVDYRPTVITFPTDYSQRVASFLPRLTLLQKEYESLIEADSANKVLGESSDYFKCYSREAVEALKMRDTVQRPTHLDEWMIPVAKNIDLDRVQFPLILVQEYGLNLFRLGATVSLGLEQCESATVHFDSTVNRIIKQGEEEGWHIGYRHQGEQQEEVFDYLINAAGFRNGTIDDMLGVPCKQMVEFKAAYISQWEEGEDILWPEVIFHGSRGTPQGMGQFTPYPGGYFQLHGMTTDITLYEEGLVTNTAVSCQPKLGQDFIEKIEQSWEQKEVDSRTKSAIGHLARFIASFSHASVGSKPLFGAQQIPGDDPTLRVAEVSFPTARYARCEIVKVSSVIDMIEAIVNELHGLGFLEELTAVEYDPFLLEEAEVTAYAARICKERDYPRDLSVRSCEEI